MTDKEQTELDEIMVKRDTFIQTAGIEGFTQAETRQALIDWRDKTSDLVLPKPFTKKQLEENSSSDRDYMLGFNRCLEEIAELRPSQRPAEKRPTDE